MNVHSIILKDEETSPSRRSTILGVLATEIGDLFDISLTLMKHSALQAAAADFTEAPDARDERLRPPARLGDEKALFAAANENPEQFFALVNQDTAASREYFEALERKVRLTPSVRQNPILRLLRHHWSWRWAEIASIMDAVSRPHDRADRLPLSDHFFPDLFRRVIKPLNGTDYALIVGPAFNRNYDTAKKIQILSAGIEKFHKGLRSAGPLPIYDRGRYFQFAHDRFGLPVGELSRKADKIAAIFDACLQATVSENVVLHSNDVRHLLHFVQAFAPQGRPRDNNDEVQYTYIYNRRSVPGPDVDHGKIELRRVSGGCEISCLGSTQEMKPPGVYASHSSEHTEELSRRLHLSCGHTNSMRSLRQLEDLAFLRYRLSGSYTRSGDAQGLIEQRNSSAENDLERMKVSIARRILGTSLNSTNASAAVLHRYYHESRRLVAEGVYRSGERYDPPSHGDDRGRVKSWLAEIASDPAQRSKSLAYFVVDHDEAVIFDPFSKGIGLHSGNQAIDCVQPPPDLNLPQAKCVIAAPVRVHGRLWGVLELAADKSQIFSVCDAEFVEKVCHMAGHYYHESLLLETLGALIGDRERDLSVYLASLPRKLSRLFLCDAVTVWRQDDIDSTKFACRGAIGRDDFSAFRDETLMQEVLTDANRSVAMQTIERGDVWQTGEIGSSPFAGDWLEKEHTRSLLQSGFKYIALIPIVDETDGANGFVSLYSKSAPFDDGWKGWAQFVAAYLSAVLGNVHEKVERETAIRREAFHTIANSIRSAISARDNIKNFVNDLPDEITANTINLHKWIADLDKHTWDIEQKISEALLDDAGDKDATSTEASRSSLATFWDEFSACFINRRKAMHESKGLSITHGAIDKTIQLRMKAEDLRNILSNLQANVAKYSSEWSAVQCEFLERSYSHRLVIKNIGPASGLPFEQRHTIFDRGVRGPYAIAAKIAGTGEGLHTVARLCGKYGIQYEYRPEPLKSSDNTERHIFTLDFPKQLIKHSAI